jgi:hypothetical protein
MSINSDNRFDSENALEEAFQLVSRQLDEALSESELSRLAALELSNPSEIQEFRQRCLHVRSLIQTFPVTHIAHPLFDVQAATTKQKTEVRTDRRGTGKFYGGLLASGLCGVLILAFLKPWNLRDAPENRADSATIPSITLADAMQTTRPAATEPVATMRTEFAQVEIPGRVADNDLPLDAMVAEPESAEMANSIRPLYQSDNWNVVVVKVNGQNRDEAMDQIQAIVHQHGLRLQRSGENSKPDWLGVVLTSTVRGSNEAVSAIEAGVGNSQTDSLPPRTTEQSEYSEIVSAVRESLRHPTRSELHHGEIFVALPTAPHSAKNNEVSAFPLPKPNSAKATQDSILSKDESRAELENQILTSPSAAANPNENAPAVVTLLVVKFESPPAIK